MAKYIRAILDPSMTDEEIRKAVYALVNGAYAVEICKGCGMYWSEIDGCLKTAKIKDRCRYCFDD